HPWLHPWIRLNIALRTMLSTRWGDSVADGGKGIRQGRVRSRGPPQGTVVELTSDLARASESLGHSASLEEVRLGRRLSRGSRPAAWIVPTPEKIYRKIRFFRSFARAGVPPNAVVGADEGVGEVLQDLVPVVNQASSLSEEKPPVIGQRVPFVGDSPVSRHEDSDLVSARASCFPLSHGQTLNQ